MLLFLVETLLIAVSVAAGIKFTFLGDPNGFGLADITGYTAHAAAIVAAFQVSFYYNDLYDFAAFRNSFASAMRLGQSLGAGCLALGGPLPCRACVDD